MRTGLVAASGRWPRWWYTDDRVAVDNKWNTASLTTSDWADPDESESWDKDYLHQFVANEEYQNYMWRTRPDPATFNPLMEAAAGAVLRMPVLQSGCVEVGMRHGYSMEAMVQWAKTGVEFVGPPNLPRRSPPEELTARRCAVWVRSEARWEVPENVTRLWKVWVSDDGEVEFKVNP